VIWQITLGLMSDSYLKGYFETMARQWHGCSVQCRWSI